MSEGIENSYVAWRLEKFNSFYLSQDSNKQVEMIRGYNWSLVRDILWCPSWRDFCELYAKFLVEEWGIKIGQVTFDDLVDKLEDFFIRRNRKTFTQFQRNSIAYMIKKNRKSRQWTK